MSGLTGYIQTLAPYVPRFATTLDSTSQATLSIKDVLFFLGMNSVNGFSTVDSLARQGSFATKFYYSLNSIIELRNAKEEYNTTKASKVKVAFSATSHAFIAVGSVIDVLIGLDHRHVVPLKLDSRASEAASAFIAIGTTIRGGIEFLSGIQAQTLLGKDAKYTQGKSIPTIKKEIEELKKQTYDASNTRTVTNQDGNIVISKSDDERTIKNLKNQLSIDTSYYKAAQAAGIVFAIGITFVAKYSELLKSPVLPLGIKLTAACLPLFLQITGREDAVLHGTPLSLTRAP